MIGIIAALVLVALGATWAIMAENEGRENSTRYLGWLNATPVPPELMLVDEEVVSGALLSGGRPAEAWRAYVTPLSVSETCALIDDFYADLDIPIRSIDGVASDDSCARSVEIEIGFISIWVDRIKPFSLVPEEYRSRDDLVTVRYSAFD